MGGDGMRRWVGNGRVEKQDERQAVKWTEEHMMGHTVARMQIDADGGREKEIETHRHRDRQTERQTDRQTDLQIDRHTADEITRALHGQRRRQQHRTPPAMTS